MSQIDAVLHLWRWCTPKVTACTHGTTVLTRARELRQIIQLSVLSIYATYAGLREKPPAAWSGQGDVRRTSWALRGGCVRSTVYGHGVGDLQAIRARLHAPMCSAQRTAHVLGHAAGEASGSCNSLHTVPKLQGCQLLDSLAVSSEGQCRRRLQLQVYDTTRDDAQGGKSRDDPLIFDGPEVAMVQDYEVGPRFRPFRPLSCLAHGCAACYTS